MPPNDQTPHASNHLFSTAFLLIVFLQPTEASPAPNPGGAVRQQAAGRI